MTPFQQFLDTLGHSLEAFDRRVAASDAGPVVRRDAGAQSGVPGEVLIGLGAPVHPEPGGALCLNNKTAAEALGLPENPTSISRLVHDAPDPLLAAWDSAVGGGADPRAVLERVRLVVEDASPDSCFGFLLMLARLAGVSAADLPWEWIAYVDAWEQGSTPANPFSAYGSLHNALVHFSIQATPGSAWRAGLHLLHEALSAGLSPGAIGPEAGGSWLAKARAALANDAQAYEANLRNATCLQLAVPLAGFPDRRQLVDACLFEETILVGAMRDFARADHLRPALRNGFSLLAIHRAGAVGSGNDITISTDPAAMLELGALWQELEAEEDRRWGGARPADHPRPLGSYPGGRRGDGTPSPNQPWYHDRDFTLLGAPKQVANGILGSRLKWTEVLENLWQLYQPLRDVRFQIGLAAATGANPKPRQPLEACRPEPLGTDPVARDSHPGQRDHGPPALAPRLFVARWDNSGAAAHGFRVTPTLGRCLAWCLARPPDHQGPIRLADLPAEGSWEMFDLPGGLAVISDHGTFLLDGGLVQAAPLADMVKAFRDAELLLRVVRDTSTRILQLLEDTHACLNGKTADAADELLAALARWQSCVARAAHLHQSATGTPLQQQFRTVLLARWGIEGWTAATAHYVQDIKEALASHTNQEINRRVAFLQSYGLPIAAGASLFGFVFAGLSPGIDLDARGVNWKGLVLYALVVLAGSLMMLGVSKVSDWRARERLRRAGRR